MKGLLHILITGVALIGFQTAFANLDDKEKKPISTDSISGGKVILTDSVVKKSDVQIGDTLVFDDYDEDDEGIIGVVISEPSRISEANSMHLFLENLKLNGTVQMLDAVTVNQMESSYDTPIDLKPEIRMYPNPVIPQNGQTLHISHNLIGLVSGMVIDQSGKAIRTMSNVGKDMTLEAPVSGVYYVVLSSSTHSATARLLVQ